MRHDIIPPPPGRSPDYAIPFQRFTWGYEWDADDSRWYLYWILRLPGRAWERDEINFGFPVRYRWQRVLLCYRERGRWGEKGTTPRWFLMHRPLETAGEWL